MSYVAVSFAAAAQAELQRKREEEETNHMHSDNKNMGEYEFKIVTSAWPTFFKNSEKFQNFLQEESSNGWELFEKLDDQRIRLIRKKSGSMGLGSGGIDPYRTMVGIGNTSSLAVFLIIMFVFVTLVSIAAFLSALS